VGKNRLIGVRLFERCEPERGLPTAWRCFENQWVAFEGLTPADQVACGSRLGNRFPASGVGCGAGSLTEESR